nr:MAG TPA: hypothetical protein [Caudoviricetes sp.]
MTCYQDPLISSVLSTVVRYSLKSLRHIREH